MNSVNFAPVRPVSRNGAAAEERVAWVRDVTALVNDMKTWSSDRGWTAVVSDVDLSEEMTGGAYRAPGLEIEAPEGRLVVRPVARTVLGADGRVDLYAWPSHYRVMLLRRAEPSGPPAWTVRTESGLDWPQPWGRETFLHIAEGLLKAE